MIDIRKSKTTHGTLWKGRVEGALGYIAYCASYESKEDLMEWMKAEMINAVIVGECSGRQFKRFMGMNNG